MIELAARGQGSLVGSVVTADPAFAREVVLGVAPWHGRLLVLDRDDAKESTGHGSPLPALVHGGPGPGRRRRGDGRHPRRAAPHAAHRGAGRARDTLAAITGRWVAGARARTRRTCTRSASTWTSCGSATRSSPARAPVTLEDIEHFAEFTGDTFYAHMDAEAAAAQPVVRRARRRTAT